MENYITVNEASKRSKLAKGYIRTLLGKGMLPGARKFGRDWMIPVSSLEAYLKSPRKRGRKKGIDK